MNAFDHYDPIFSPRRATPPRAKPLGTSQHTRPSMNRRILLAEPEAATRNYVKPILRSLGAEITEVFSGAELEEQLVYEGPFSLVVTSAQLPGQTGLQVLARLRSKGDQTPFIVVQSTHQLLMRVFVSDAEGTVLSSRMVDGDNLAVLASSLLDRASAVRA